MLISRYLHKKRSEVSIKTRSTPASLSFKGQATEHTTVKWPIRQLHLPSDRKYSIPYAISLEADWLIALFTQVIG